MAGLVTLCGKW